MLWGSLYVVSKYAFATIPPLTLLFLRYLIAGIPLGFVAFKKGLKKVEKNHWKYFLCFGATGYFASIALQMTATSIMNASVASLINSLNPIFISIFAVLFLKENMTPNKFIGIACSILGVAIVLGISGNGVSVLGVVFSLLSVILWSFNSVMIRKISGYYCSEQITLFGVLMGLPFCLVASVVELQTKSIYFTPISALAVIYLAVFCTAVTNLCWNKSLKVFDASFCSMFYPLQPLFSALLGIVILGEPITRNFVVGGILISFGIIIGLLKGKKSRQ
jgi:drug/metabolite transporter (DMT)-like permease